MRKPYWAAVGAGIPCLLAAAFLLGGGVYRTVNAGGGRVYVVNRFTGSAREVGVPRRPPTAKTEESRIMRIGSEAKARGAEFVGDTQSRLYHYTPFVSDAEEPSRAEVYEGTCRALRSTIYPCYFSNTLEALSAGYWPCAICFPPGGSWVVAHSVKVHTWPHAEAPVCFQAARGDEVCEVAYYGEWIAMELVNSATGERSVGWLRSASIYPGRASEGRDKQYALRWAADAEEAHRMRVQGLSPEAIQAKKGWDSWYVQTLLDANVSSE